MIDADELAEAIEIALGNTISSEIAQDRSAKRTVIKRHTTFLKRLLAELDPGLTVAELLEALEREP